MRKDKCSVKGADNMKPRANSTLKNIAIVQTAMLRRYPSYRLMLPLSLLIQVANPALTTLIPSLVIDAVTKADAARFLAVITGTLMVYWLLQAANEWFDRTLAHERIYTRIGVYVRDINKKIFTTDYLNIEPQPRQKALEKALNSIDGNGYAGAEGLLREFCAFAVILLGIVSYGGALLTLDARIVLATLVMFVLDVALRTHAIRYSDAHREENTESRRKRRYINSISRNISAGKDIRIYQMELWFHRLSDHMIAQGAQYVKKTGLRWYFPTVSDIVCILFRDLLAYAILIRKVINGEMNAAEFTLYLGVVAGFSNWIYNLANTCNNLILASHEFNDYVDFMQTPDVFRHTPAPHSGRQSALSADDFHGSQPQASTLSGSDRPMPDTPCEIEFRHVCFCYEGSDTPVLYDLSFTLRAGEKVALVGNNGAGKTTIVKLLCGLYAPTGGEIFVDGVNLLELDIEEYQDRISVLFQDTTPLSFTIAMNVAGCEADQFDRGRVQDSLKKAGLWEKVVALKHREDTYLSQTFDAEGIQLSGGEVQKLLLAKAIYKSGSILVLDEPTSALDPLAESQIYEEYNAMAEEKTALYISHRLASTKFCDRILFLENGQVAESGTHAELMRKNGKYKEIFDIQSHYYKKEKTAHEE